MSGSFDPKTKAVPHVNVTWYGAGGLFDTATLIGLGERGAELGWPSYEPYLSRYGAAIADHMKPGGGGVVINLNYTTDDGAKRIVRDIAREIKMQKAMGAI